MHSNNKMGYSRAPLHQKTIKIVMWILGGFVALGVVLDSVANAISLLTPLVASIGTACIVLVLVIARIILPTHPLPWVVGDQQVRVTKLGAQPTAVAVGIIFLLWMPWVIVQLPRLTDMAKAKLFGLGDLTIAVSRVEAPVFWLFNAGRARADKPEYQFFLYNLNKQDYMHTGWPREILNGPRRPFEGYILPQHVLGPLRIGDAKEVELGDTLFGSVMVQCANCGTGRHYWIFLKVGSAGWTLEVPASQRLKIFPMLMKIFHRGEPDISRIDSVIPLEGRKPIE
jgi:hypothetical protein